MTAGATPLLKLPLLYVGQAQKEITHNEALTLIDCLLSPAVQAIASAPPAAPLTGQAWIVGTGATGAWLGADNGLALWTDGGWRIIAVGAGFTRTLPDGSCIRFDGNSWSMPSAIAKPAGGSVVDVEGRAALGALIDALATRGLLAH